MNDVMGAYCTLRFNDGGGEVSSVLFSFEMYDEALNGTVSGIRDEDVFYYVDSKEQLLSMVDPANCDADFTILSIDDWVANG